MLIHLSLSPCSLKSVLRNQAVLLHVELIALLAALLLCFCQCGTPGGLAALQFFVVAPPAGASIGVRAMWGTQQVRTAFGNWIPGRYQGVNF